MDEQSGAGWEQQQANEERYRMNVEALNRCVAAGARIEDIKLLAHECGIDINHIQIGTRHAKTQ